MIVWQNEEMVGEVSIKPSLNGNWELSSSSGEVAVVSDDPGELVDVVEQSETLTWRNLRK